MKQKILTNRGAYQENLLQESSAPPLRRKALKRQQDTHFSGISQSLNVDESACFDISENEFVPVPSLASNLPELPMQALSSSIASRRIQDNERQSSLDRTTIDTVVFRGEQGMFYTTVPEGRRILLIDKDGKGEIIKGPQRIWTRKKKVIWLEHHIAFPGEFLVIKFKDGSQEHRHGPTELWFDPREHAHVEKEDVVQIAGKEAVVVYAQDDTASVQRRVVEGPAVFVPEPGEWLHTFSWHGSSQGGAGYTKVPNGLVFQKLWLMPDQMYHDVNDVRTADDVVLTVRLMMFFELLDVQTMLKETHDPIGDFINAASSDVLDLVGRYTFDVFKTRTELLNDLENYPQLVGRAKQVGYKIHKIVYRGYATSEALERMHEQAIETRTRLKLQRETENQAQELADFKQQREHQRTTASHTQEKANEAHELERQRQRHEQTLALKKQSLQEERTQRLLDAEQESKMRQEQLEQWIFLNEKLQGLGVDLTSYLTQARADQVFEFRNADGKPLAPHVHIPPTDTVNRTRSKK